MKKCLLAMLAVFCLTASAMAQRTISGTITGQDGEALIGASVLLKGTTTGTVTDVDGSYSLSVPAGAEPVLLISYTGFADREITVGASNTVDVTLEEASELLSEVVVTALGFETQRKKVGVASTTVEGDAISRSGEVGLINGLAGKSAGLQVISSSGEPGAGAAMRIRGATSITGGTQPLIVVDGIPIFNDSYYGQGFGGEVTTSGGSIGSGGGVTQQSRLNDLNPDDIESVEVLRGASAAAVWGSRAANGVLLIRTKKGKFKAGKQWTVNVNSSLAIDQLNREVPLQHEYSGGVGQIYSFNPPGGLSWGDKIADRPGGEDTFIKEGDPGYTGKFISDQTGNTIYRIANGTVDNVHGGKNSKEIHDVYDYLFQNGATWSNSLSISNAGENGSVYFSLAQLNQDGIIAANSTYDRTTARLNATHNVGKFKIEGSAGYTYSTSQRAQMGSNLNGLFLGGLREVVDFDSRDYEGTFVDATGKEFPGMQRAYRNPLGANMNSIYNNPVFTINRVDSKSLVNRFLGKLELRYDATSWLNFTARGGVDSYTDERDDFYPFFSAGENNGGRYTKETITGKQVTFDLIGRARFNFTPDIALNALIGVGLNDRTLDDHGATSRNFVNPFSPPQLPNGTIVPFNYSEHERFASQYATLGFEFFDQLFLNLNARQDFLSTLPQGDQGVFYPGADVSWQFSKYVRSTPISSGRLRAGYGQVGRGPQVYLTKQVYFQPTSANIGWGEGWGPGVDVANYGGGFALLTTAANPDIKPEIKTELEFGLDLGFAKDRFTLGATYYRNKTDDLIIQVLTPQSAGFVSQITNAASIENNGVELEFNFAPVRKANFEWNIYGNFSKNRNEVTRLAGTNSILLSGFEGSSSNAVLGEQLGVIYGTQWVRDANGNLDLDENGFPQLGETSGVLGDPNPDFRIGAGSGLTWKNLSVNVLFDMSQGGEFWNGTRGALAFFGRAKYTAKEATLTEEQANNLKIYTGATVADTYGYLQNADGSYTLRGEVKDYGAGDVFVEETWYRIGPGSGFTGPTEEFVEDASWMRLRELTLSYRFTKDLLKINWLENATLTFTGRNLFLWTDYQGNDPDTNLTGAGLNGLGLDYFQNPSARTYKLSLNLTF